LLFEHLGFRSAAASLEQRNCRIHAEPRQHRSRGTQLGGGFT
jgi:hypothetical protein